MCLFDLSEDPQYTELGSAQSAQRARVGGRRCATFTSSKCASKRCQQVWCCSNTSAVELDAVGGADGPVAPTAD